MPDFRKARELDPSDNNTEAGASIFELIDPDFEIPLPPQHYNQDNFQKPNLTKFDLEVPYSIDSLSFDHFAMSYEDEIGGYVEIALEAVQNQIGDKDVPSNLSEVVSSAVRGAIEQFFTDHNMLLPTRVVQGELEDYPIEIEDDGRVRDLVTGLVFPLPEKASYKEYRDATPNVTSSFLDYLHKEYGEYIRAGLLYIPHLPQSLQRMISHDNSQAGAKRDALLEYYGIFNKRKLQIYSAQGDVNARRLKRILSSK